MIVGGFESQERKYGDGLKILQAMFTETTSVRRATDQNWKEHQKVVKTLEEPSEQVEADMEVTLAKNTVQQTVTHPNGTSRNNNHWCLIVHSRLPHIATLCYGNCTWLN